MTTTNIGVLPWKNETGGFNYPLSSNSVSIPDVFVDAYWIQFDSFIPVLNSIEVTDLSLAFKFTTDHGVVETITSWPIPDDVLEVIEPVTGKLLGRVIFGDGVDEFYATNIGSLVTLNAPFVASTVYGVPYDSGVFSFNGAAGDVTVNPDDNLFFSQQGDGVVFDAVGIPTCNPDVNPLKTINGLNAPNISLNTNDVINWIPSGNGIRLELASGTIFNANIQPST